MYRPVITEIALIIEKVNANRDLKPLTNNMSYGVLPLDNETLKRLK